MAWEDEQWQHGGISQEVFDLPTSSQASIPFFEMTQCDVHFNLSHLTTLDP